MDHSIKTRLLKKYEAGQEACKTDSGHPAMDFYSPFGPMIAKVRAQQALLDRINGYADGKFVAGEGREIEALGDRQRPRRDHTKVRVR